MLVGIWCDLRCLSVVVMLVCSSGTTVLILETDGLLCVQVARRVAIAPPTATAFSGRMCSTLVKAAGARI